MNKKSSIIESKKKKLCLNIIMWINLEFEHRIVTMRTLFIGSSFIIELLMKLPGA